MNQTTCNEPLQDGCSLLNSLFHWIRLDKIAKAEKYICLWTTKWNIFSGESFKHLLALQKPNIQSQRIFKNDYGKRSSEKKSEKTDKKNSNEEKGIKFQQ